MTISNIETLTSAQAVMTAALDKQIAALGSELFLEGVALLDTDDIAAAIIEKVDLTLVAPDQSLDAEWFWNRYNAEQLNLSEDVFNTFIYAYSKVSEAICNFEADLDGEEAVA